MTNWDAWTAIGTLALAAATIALAWVTVKAGKADRTHDDAKRAEDRARDDTKRAEDRARDDRLRQEQLDQLHERERVERIAREDYEARQVLVRVEKKDNPGHGHNFNRRITLSTPHAYPIKQVEGCLVVPGNGGLAITPFGHSGDDPYIDDQRIYYGFWAEAPVNAYRADPIMKFVDWHGNLYYQYRNYTQRFSQNTDSCKAAQAIDEWIRTGPKAD